MREERKRNEAEGALLHSSYENAHQGCFSCADSKAASHLYIRLQKKERGLVQGPAPAQLLCNLVYLSS